MSDIWDYLGRRSRILRRGILMSSRATNKFSELCPELSEKLGIGVSGWGSRWIIWFPFTKRDEEEIIRKLRELNIPHKVYISIPGPEYIE